MQLPISIPLAVISRYIEEHYSGLLFTGVTTDWTGGDTHIEVRKTGEATLRAQQNRLLISMPLEIVLDIRKNDPGIINVFKSIGGLRQLRFSISVSFLFRPSWADGWKLHLVVDPDFEWIKKPRIASVLKVSVAAWIGPAIRQAIRKQAEEMAEKIVEEMALEERVPDIWRKIQQPVLIEETHQIWLDLLPGPILHRTEINCRDQELRMVVELPATARVAFSRLADPALSPLPHVATRLSMDQISAHALSWQAGVPLEWMNSQVEEFHRMLLGVEQIEVQSSGEALVIKAILRLGTKGVHLTRTVKLTAKLATACSPQYIGVEIIQVELESPLKWIRGLLGKKITTILNQLLSQQIAELIQQLESTLVHQQLGNAWSLSASELTPSVSIVEIEAEMIHISGELYGKVGLRLDHL